MDCFLLLDRSSSMASVWDETLGSINAFVGELQREESAVVDATGKPILVTLATFDAPEGTRFDVIRDHQRIGEWKPVTSLEAAPRGTTPLHDSIMRLVAMAEASDDDRVSIAIVTDGAENASREATRSAAKAALDRCQARGWQIAFLGVNFDAFSESSSIGIAPAMTLNTQRGATLSAFASHASNTANYASTGTATSFTPTQRATAMGHNTGDDSLKERLTLAEVEAKKAAMTYIKSMVSKPTDQKNDEGSTPEADSGLDDKPTA